METLLYLVPGKLLGKNKIKILLTSFIFHKNLAYKVSFFIWRALRGKLPTNEKLITFVKEASDDYYCYRPRKDKIEHILAIGNFAKTCLQNSCRFDGNNS